MMLRAAFVPPEPVLHELREVSSRLGVLAGLRSSPPDRLDVPVAGFGNVTETDLRRLRALLATRLADEPAPIVRFAGIDVDQDGDVLVPLIGDVEQLMSISRLVAQLAARVNLYVDRRRFRPALPIATLTRPTTGSAVPGLVRATPAWTGMEWEAAGVSLIRTRWFAGGAICEEIGFVELGHPLDHLTEA